VPAKPKAKTTSSTRTRATARTRTSELGSPDVNEVIATLKGMANASIREGMARYAIPSHHALGISVGALRKLAKQLGPSHELALALWESEIYEARMLAAFVGEPERLSAAQMDRFCRDFDNWAICDTMCFALFDRTPQAFARIPAWAKAQEEFVKRAAFALLASLALHDKTAEDAEFQRLLPLIERAATDPRNFVKKGVSWALRGVGRRNSALHKPCVQLAKTLAASDDATARWIGKDALRDLTKPARRKRA
jgi:3-methyladenine DNA glycosylase AlkD